MNQPASRRQRQCRFLVTALAAATVIGACGPDGPDVYSAPADDVATTATDPDSATDTSAPAGETAGTDPADGSADSVPPNGVVVDVRALDNSFIEDVVEIAAGTEVHWQNRGRNDHDVVPVADGEEWGVALDDFTPGDSYSHVFTTPGTYRYYCTIHGTADVGMIGTIVVT